jgi:hypothetical protein
LRSRWLGTKFVSDAMWTILDRSFGDSGNYSGEREFFGVRIGPFLNKQSICVASIDARTQGAAFSPIDAP